MTDEECLELVRSGFFRVEPDGSIWRLQTTGRTGMRRDLPSAVRADYEENNGYRRVRYGKHGSITAHRLVWLVFRGPIPPGMEVNHKNLQNGENRVSNLELLTHQRNVMHSKLMRSTPALPKRKVKR